MCRLRKYILLLPLLALSTVSIVWSQGMINGDTVHYCTNIHDYVSFQYIQETNEFDGWMVIHTDQDSIFLNYNTTYNQGATTTMHGYFDIWDGDPDSGTLIIDHFSGIFTNTVLHYNSDRITLHLHYDAYSIDTLSPLSRSILFYWNETLSTDTCSDTVNGIIVYRTTTTEAVIKWTPEYVDEIAKILDIRVKGPEGTLHYVTNDDSLHLTGLTPNSQYVVTARNQTNDNPCCAKKLIFYTDPEPYTGVPNVTDLHSSYVRGTYGTYSNPFLNVGIKDFGPNSLSSRHCIMTDTTATDPCTLNQLHTVCPGKHKSVRLGNQMVGSEAESLTYFLHIDTQIYSIIIVHYAAVLQDPQHNSYEQPKFNVEILDDRDSVISRRCGAAYFIADASLGWNDNLWKDWTTIALNLAPYHGMDVRLRFTTYDCNQGGHFGYAYFYAEASIPSAVYETCGNTDTVTVSAPDGFNYTWYFDNITDPYSTSQAVSFPASLGNIHCRLSFVEDSSCYITMDTYASPRYPLAIIDTFSTTNNGCDGFEVQFLNRSTIIDQDSNILPSSTCETAHWYFGDGYTSTQYNPKHSYFVQGEYSVLLVSGLAGGQCIDTCRFTVVVPDNWVPADKETVSCDSLLWDDGNWYYSDTIGPQYRKVNPRGCDTIFTLHLSIVNGISVHLATDTFCYNSTYTWQGQTVGLPNIADTSHYLLSDVYPAANGCDSTVYMPLVQMPPDNLEILWQPDCGAGSYLLTAGTDLPLLEWYSFPHDTCLDGHEQDSQLLVHPFTETNYILTTYYNDSLFCPTTKTLQLSPPTFPTAEMSVTPLTLTYDQNTLNAHDRSAHYPHRHWMVVNHGQSHDTIHLLDSSRTVSYNASLAYDSLTVLLSVSNGVCLDTARQTVEFLKCAIFAPNVFTPSLSDNNRFIISGPGILEAKLTIFNRNGLLVYKTDDISQGWDGTHNGVAVPQAGYVWYLQYKTIEQPQKWQTAYGEVLLLR